MVIVPIIGLALKHRRGLIRRCVLAVVGFFLLSVKLIYDGLCDTLLLVMPGWVHILAIDHYALVRRRCCCLWTIHCLWLSSHDRLRVHRDHELATGARTRTYLSTPVHSVGVAYTGK